MRLITTLLLAALTLGGCATVPPPTLDQVIALSREGRPVSEIIALLDASAAVYPLSASEIGRLSRAGVADPVLDVMLENWVGSQTRRAFVNGQVAALNGNQRPYLGPIGSYGGDAVAVTSPAPAGVLSLQAPTDDESALPDAAASASDAAVSTSEDKAFSPAVATAAPDNALIGPPAPAPIAEALITSAPITPALITPTPITPAPIGEATQPLPLIPSVLAPPLHDPVVLRAEPLAADYEARVAASESPPLATPDTMVFDTDPGVAAQGDSATGAGETPAPGSGD